MPFTGDEVTSVRIVIALLSFIGFELRSTDALAQVKTPKQIYEASRDSIVVVYALDDNGTPGAFGTGFFVSDGSTIVTNYHVLEGANSWAIKLTDGGVYPVIRVVAAARDDDIAVLRVNAKRKALALSSKKPEVGDSVVVIGHPRGSENTLSIGIVSSIDLSTLSNGYDFQISAPISPGNSGGPVLSDEGLVVGVATATRTNAQNLNFAQSIQRARALLAQSAKAPSQRPRSSSPGIPTESTTASRDLSGSSDVLSAGKAAAMLVVEDAQIVDASGRPASLKLTLRNDSDCALGGLSMRGQFKGGPNREDPFVFEKQFAIEQVVAPGSRIVVVQPVEEAHGHGVTEPIWNRWFAVMTVLSVRDTLCPRG